MRLGLGPQGCSLCICLCPKFTWVAALVVAARMSYAYVQDWLRVNRVESDISDIVNLKT